MVSIALWRTRAAQCGTSSGTTNQSLKRPLPTKPSNYSYLSQRQRLLRKNSRIDSVRIGGVAAFIPAWSEDLGLQAGDGRLV